MDKLFDNRRAEILLKGVFDEPLLRITSYNVCYTKLLRTESIDHEVVIAASGNRSRLADGIEPRGRPELLPFLDVIGGSTGYSPDAGIKVC